MSDAAKVDKATERSFVVVRLDGEDLSDQLLKLGVPADAILTPDGVPWFDREGNIAVELLVDR